MITAKELTQDIALRSLASDRCPSCGGRKDRRKTLCGPEYFKLPKAMRNALYNGTGHGYEEAVIEALNFLGAEKVLLPEAKLA